MILLPSLAEIARRFSKEISTLCALPGIKLALGVMSETAKHWTAPSLLQSDRDRNARGPTRRKHHRNETRKLGTEISQIVSAARWSDKPPSEQYSLIGCKTRPPSACRYHSALLHFSFPINPMPIQTPPDSTPGTHHESAWQPRNKSPPTAPTTPEGKKITAQNSTRHGVLAQTVVLEGESKSRFEELLTAYIALIQPRSAAETAIVETMTIARWKQMRIWGIEKAGFQLEMSRESSAAGANATRGYLTFKNSPTTPASSTFQHRYETGYERQFCRA
jgi:hypothetical protein